MPTDKTDIHAQALERYEEAEGYWGTIYQTIGDDIDFALNIDEAQWADVPAGNPNEIRLVYNKTQAEIVEVVNEMRASRPAIKVSPVDDGADKDTAEVINGLIRNTEYRSDASTAYDTSAFAQVAGGLGFLRLTLDWVQGTFDQEPCIDTVPDMQSVLIDPLSRELDGSDMRYAFVLRDNMSEEEFKAEYPKAEPIDFAGGKTSGWCTDKTVRVADYYYKVQESRKILLITDGETEKTVHEDEFESLQAQAAALGYTLQILKERTELVDVVKHCILNGQEILEETEWPSQYIPVIPVYGMMVFNGGERHVSGMVKLLRDPQKDYNWSKSKDAQYIALQPVTPWITAIGSVPKEVEKYYTDANLKNYPMLPYVAYDDEGRPLPPPTRAMPPQPNMAMIQRAMMAAEDMKSVVGKRYDEGGKTLGAESGTAILLKERRAQSNNFHFMDNQGKSIAHCGRILVDLIPKVYSGPRIVRILGEDGAEERVPVNKPGTIMKEGKKAQGIYRLDAGKYDVTVNIGPSFASRRQESVQALIEVMGTLPNATPLAYMALKNMDFPGADDAAELLKKTMPPELFNDEVTPEQAMMQQAAQAIELLKGQIGKLQEQLMDKRRSEDQKHQIDLINAGLKEKEIEIKAFEASIKAAQAQAQANERMQPQDFVQMAQTIMNLQANVEDFSTALTLLLDADAGPQNVNQAPNA